MVQWVSSCGSIAGSDSFVVSRWMEKGHPHCRKDSWMINRHAFKWIGFESVEEEDEGM